MERTIERKKKNVKKNDINEDGNNSSCASYKQSLDDSKLAKDPIQWKSDPVST
jgi:hypothetical protein